MNEVKIYPRNEVEQDISNIFIRNALKTLQHKIPNFEQLANEIHFNLVSYFPSYTHKHQNTVGFSIMSNLHNIYFFFNIKPWLTGTIDWKEVAKTGKHEAFHICQMEYMIRHFGINGLVQRLKKYAQMPYNENPMEIGAYNYENDPYGYFQDCNQ